MNAAPAAEELVHKGNLNEQRQRKEYSWQWTPDRKLCSTHRESKRTHNPEKQTDMIKMWWELAIIFQDCPNYRLLAKQSARLPRKTGTVIVHRTHGTATIILTRNCNRVPSFHLVDSFNTVKSSAHFGCTFGWIRITSHTRPDRIRERNRTRHRDVLAVWWKRLDVSTVSRCSNRDCRVSITLLK